MILSFNDIRQLGQIGLSFEVPKNPSESLHIIHQSSDGILFTSPSKTNYQIENPDSIYEDQTKTFPDRLQAENRWQILTPPEPLLLNKSGYPNWGDKM
ncbi:MAG: hypothetical protein A2156_09155 [Deltaproteobacteria bacterium RBG_16_48_10]|nr:MAG: hypothetical protein A2156_09155 [Deltaproteobacteria bacterium RBG_16_48_10]